ncbi:MAG: DUF4303 domain-containing protein [Saccharospirillaceae bacterium]|nr:DUF4303 domain-containing protein [Saccharospirillaceae bacterium]
MKNIIDFKELELRVKVASKKSFEFLEKRFGKNVITGFALCTDDGAMTIFHSANIQSWDTNPYEFSPVEWRIDDKPDLFDSAYDLIEERLDKQDEEEYEDQFEEIVNQTFNSFVNALMKLKVEGVFPDNVFLSVLSTDPSDDMITKERKSIEQLNSKIIIEKWKGWSSQFN